MQSPTKLYVIAVTTNNGEWLKFAETDKAEHAMQIASAEHARVIARRQRAPYYHASCVDVMKRNSQGDYDGIAQFKRAN